MRKRQTFEIEGHNIEVFQLPIKTSLIVLARLTQILARPIGSAIGSAQASSDPLKSNLDKEINIGEIIGTLGDRIDEDIVISTIEMAIPYLTIDQKVAKNLESFDEYGPIFLLKAMAKVLEVNFGDFLGDLLGKGRERIAQIQAQKE